MEPPLVIRQRTLLVSLGIFLASFILGISLGASAAVGDKSGTPHLVAASSNNFPPVNTLNADGHLTGFGRDLAEAVVGAVGGDVNHIHSPIWTEVLQWLTEGKADFIHDTGYTPERTAFLDFSEPILDMPEEIFVLNDRFDVQSIESLRGKKVACVNKHITHLYLQKIKDVECHIVKTPPAGVKALVAGEVDAFIYPRQIVLHYAHKFDVADQIKSVGIPLRNLTWHMTVRKGDTRTLLLLNRGLALVRASGEYERIYDKWFGQTIVQGFSWIQVIWIAGTILTVLLVVTVIFTVWNWSLRQAAISKTTELRASEQRFKDFAESSSDWFWETDELGRFTDISIGYRSHTGFDPSIFFGKTRKDASTEDKTDDKWLRHFDDLNHHRPFRNFTYEMEILDGTKMWIRINGKPVFTHDGVFLGYRGTGSDITEQKLAEDTLKESEQRFRHFFESIPDVLMMTNLEDGRCVSVNEEFCRLSGYTYEEAIGTKTIDLNLWKDPKGREKLISQLGKDGFTRNLNAEFRKKDGSFWPGLMTAGIVLLDGTRHFVSSTKDLTDEKRTEEALRRSQKLEAVGQMTGGIAHDFNNLLGIVMGNLEILKRKSGDDASLSDWIDRALKGATRGAELTQNLLQFSRKKAHGTKVISINDHILKMDDLLKKSMTAKIEFHFDLETDLWLTEIDPGDFADSLTNLVINAGDAMPQGGVLSISTTNKTLNDGHVFTNLSAVPGEYICLEITDTGTGIEEEVLDKVFEPFFTTKERGKGTGLGLSMVFGFVIRSGGDIAINSNPGHGTTCQVYLPRATDDDTEQATIDEIDLETLRGAETILIVDDEEDLLEIATEHLQGLGYNTLTAIDGRQALSLLSNRKDIDLLFSDVVMPKGINGFQLAKRGFAADPGLKVLLTSGFASEEFLSKSGVDFSDELTNRLAADLLPKPYSQEQLAIKVRHTLDKDTEK